MSADQRLEETSETYIAFEPWFFTLPCGPPEGAQKNISSITLSECAFSVVCED
jgi:hypothetical protein